MNKNTMIVCIAVVVVAGLVIAYSIHCNRQVMLAKAGNEGLHLLKKMEPSKMVPVPKEAPVRNVIAGFMRPAGQNA